MSREVIFEFVQVGNSVKVTALDAETLVEVSIVGSPTAPRSHLKSTALRKLRYVLRRRRTAADGKGKVVDVKA
ncbi:MAG: hypothetical protein FJX55_02620 [Alphaproteobacteria bacterium]|nr:hypothetical protein [Alphaproteobacteria bacterium]